MKREQGQDLFNLPVWQQDGAKPHQVNSIFKDKMLTIESRRGDTCAPSSLDLKPLDFFCGYISKNENLEVVNAKIKGVGIDRYGSSRYRYMFLADISADTDTNIFG